MKNLVSQPEEQIRRLIGFLDLEWDDACLAHEKQKSSVNTASMHQVRQAVYKDAKDKYLKYAEFLGPLMRHSGSVSD